MDSFEKIYKLLKYSNKLNTIKYLGVENNNDIDLLYKMAKKAYINGQSGGEHTDLSSCKEIYISNFHGKMVGESFTIPNNTWVIVPFGTGFVNYLGKEEKEFFLQNRDVILNEFNKNNGKTINLFGKNFFILKPGDTYCNVEITINFDNMIDEGLYEVAHAQKIIMDPFYRKINFGDIFVNPLEENYLIGFNILQKYKDIIRLVLHRKDPDFDFNTIKNDPDAFMKDVKNDLRKKGDRVSKITPFSENDYLVKNNISRILYPLFIEKTLDVVNKIYLDLIEQITNLELPIDDHSSDYDDYTKIVIDFKTTWGINEILDKTMDPNLKYNKIINTITTISYVLTRNIDKINNKNLSVKYADNLSKLKNINDELVRQLKENVNYEIIFDAIIQQNFNTSLGQKISLLVYY